MHGKKTQIHEDYEIDRNQTDEGNIKNPIKRFRSAPPNGDVTNIEEDNILENYFNQLNERFTEKYADSEADEEEEYMRNGYNESHSTDSDKNQKENLHYKSNNTKNLEKSALYRKAILKNQKDNEGEEEETEQSSEDEKPSFFSSNSRKEVNPQKVFNQIKNEKVNNSSESDYDSDVNPMFMQSRKKSGNPNKNENEKLIQSNKINSSNVNIDEEYSINSSDYENLSKTVPQTKSILRNNSKSKKVQKSSQTNKSNQLSQFSNGEFYDDNSSSSSLELISKSLPQTKANKNNNGSQIKKTHKTDKLAKSKNNDNSDSSDSISKLVRTLPQPILADRSQNSRKGKKARLDDKLSHKKRSERENRISYFANNEEYGEDSSDFVSDPKSKKFPYSTPQNAVMFNFSKDSMKSKKKNQSNEVHLTERIHHQSKSIRRDDSSDNYSDSNSKPASYSGTSTSLAFPYNFIGDTKKNMSKYEQNNYYEEESSNDHSSSDDQSYEGQKDYYKDHLPSNFPGRITNSERKRAHKYELPSDSTKTKIIKMKIYKNPQNSLQNPKKKNNNEKARNRFFVDSDDYYSD